MGKSVSRLIGIIFLMVLLALPSNFSDSSRLIHWVIFLILGIALTMWFANQLTTQSRPLKNFETPGTFFGLWAVGFIRQPVGFGGSLILFVVAVLAALFWLKYRPRFWQMVLTQKSHPAFNTLLSKNLLFVWAATIVQYCVFSTFLSDFSLDRLSGIVAALALIAVSYVATRFDKAEYDSINAQEFEEESN